VNGEQKFKREYLREEGAEIRDRFASGEKRQEHVPEEKNNASDREEQVERIPERRDPNDNSEGFAEGHFEVILTKLTSDDRDKYDDCH
jgi:hypothetical protein